MCSDFVGEYLYRMGARKFRISGIFMETAEMLRFPWDCGSESKPKDLYDCILSDVWVVMFYVQTNVGKSKN